MAELGPIVGIQFNEVVLAGATTIVYIPISIRKGCVGPVGFSLLIVLLLLRKGGGVWGGGDPQQVNYAS